MYSFPYLEPVCYSMSSSNCCFLTCMQISQEAGQVVWYSHLLKNFPQFVVIHTVKGFGVVNKAEVDVFWNSLAFSMINDFTSILIFFSSILIWTLPVLIMYLRKKKISLAETCSRFEEKNEEKELSWLMFFLTSWPEPQHPGLVLLREAPTETGRLPHNRQAFIFSSEGYLASLVTVPKPSRIFVP